MSTHATSTWLLRRKRRRPSTASFYSSSHIEMRTTTSLLAQKEASTAPSGKPWKPKRMKCLYPNSLFTSSLCNFTWECLLQTYQEWAKKVEKRQRLSEALGELEEEADAELERAENEAEQEDGAGTGDAEDDAVYLKRGTNKIATGAELDNLVQNLNNGQRTIFSKVINCIRHQVLHAEMAPGDSSCAWSSCKSSTPPPPLRQIVLGGAGTGKSRLIFALNGQVHRDSILPSQLLKFQVGSPEEAALLAEDGAKAQLDQAMAEGIYPDVVSINAPTGVAAYLISGSTIHSTFSVPVITSTDAPPPPTELRNDRLKELKRRFRDTRLIIVDEVSHHYRFKLLIANFKWFTVIHGFEPYTLLHPPPAD